MPTRKQTPARKQTPTSKQMPALKQMPTRKQMQQQQHPARQGGSDTAAPAMTNPPLTLQIPVPKDVPCGALIGRGGCISKALSATHHIRVYVDCENECVVLTGGKQNVQAAKFQVLRIIEDRQVTLTLRLLQHLRPFADDHTAKTEKKAAPASIKVDSGPIPSIGELMRQNALRDAQSCLWFFDRAPPDLLVDPTIRSFPYLLRRLSILERPDAVQDKQTAWIAAFDERFVQHMMRQATSLNSSAVKVKAVLGVTHYRLRSGHLSAGIRWPQLRTLKMPQDLTSQWSNDCNPHSACTTALLQTLQTLAHDQGGPLQQVLTVMLHDEHSKESMVLKYHQTTTGDWVPVERPAHRVAHRLYSIALDDDTAFRLRLVSRDDAFDSLADQVASKIEIRASSSQPHNCFAVQVSLRPDAPRGIKLVRYVVKVKIHVRYAGLCFTLQYLDPSKRRVRLEARVASTASAVALPRRVRVLTETLVGLLTRHA